jgi:hypothetical protein
VVVAFAVVIALAAAVRSTWSPCGLSMLSQITPVAEAGRQQKFGRTAAWFVVGAVLGGLSLGAAIALGAAAVGATGLGSNAAIALAVVFTFISAAVDARVLGVAPPFLRRQVNEDWLSNYRSWVYGGGFGWQIGAGVTTYVMTAAVPLIIVLGALSANPWAGLSIGVVFGLTRGLAVLLGAPVRSYPALLAFHRRFERWSEPVRQAVIGVQLAVGAVAAWIVAPPLVAIVITLAAGALFVWCRTSDRQARPTNPVVA